MTYCQLIILITLLFNMSLTVVRSIHIDEGCEVKSEWKFEYNWPDILVSTWVAKESTSPILTIELEFDGHFLPITYDNLVISDKEIQVERIRDAKTSTVKNQTSFVVGDGWVDFTFSVGFQYCLKYGNDVMHLGSVDYLPKTITIKGSNVTVNCQSEMRAWKMSNGPKSLPFEDVEEHLISFYSMTEFLPILNLELRDFSLGWNEGELTTIPSLTKPLPPFVLHNLTISCRKEADTKCLIRVGEEKRSIEEFRIGDLPKSVTIERNQGEYFYVFLHKGCPLMNCGAEVPEPEETLSCCGIAGVAALGGLLILIILLIIIYVVIRYSSRFQKSIKGCAAKSLSTERVAVGDPERACEEIEPLKRASFSSKDSGIVPEQGDLSGIITR